MSKNDTDKYIGRKLDGRYQIDRLIGVGGMSYVYRATDLNDNSTVAVKILKDEYAGVTDLVRRFRNESKAVRMLNHENIVKVLDVNYSDSVQYIVMEYLEGITLKQYMEKHGALSWKETVSFSEQLLKAIQHAHDRELNGLLSCLLKAQEPDGHFTVKSCEEQPAPAFPDIIFTRFVNLEPVLQCFQDGSADC